MREEEMAIGIISILAVFGLPFLGLMFWLVLHYCHATVKAWMEAKLKRDMVARGYTAQEIVQVVSSGKGSRPEKTTDVPPAKPIKQPAYG